MDNLPVAAPAVPAAPAAPAAVAAAKTADASTENDALPWIAAFQAAVTQHARGLKPPIHGAATPDPAALTDASASAAAASAATTVAATDAGADEKTPPWIAALQATLTQQDKSLTAAQTHRDDENEPAGKDDGATDGPKNIPVDGAAAASLPAPLVAAMPTTTPAVTPATPLQTRSGNSHAATTGMTDTDPRQITPAQTAGAIAAPKSLPATADAAAAQVAATRQIESRAIDNVATRDGAGPDAGLPSVVQFAPAHAAPATAAPAAAQLQIDASVGSRTWGAELGQKVVWMIGEKQHVAELHVNPPDLGPLDIKLTVTDNQTTAVFTSPHGAVRDAVESALPRLREVLAESGILLGNASVTADSPRDGSAFANPQDQAGRGNFGARSHESVPGPAQSTAAHLIRRNGLVDLFA